MILYVRISARMMDHAYTLSCLGGELLIAKQTSKEPDWRPADIKLMKPIKQHKGRPACVCVTWIYMDQLVWSSIDSFQLRWPCDTALGTDSDSFAECPRHFQLKVSQETGELQVITGEPQFAGRSDSLSFRVPVSTHRFTSSLTSFLSSRARTWHWALWSSCGIVWPRPQPSRYERETNTSPILRSDSSHD